MCLGAVLFDNGLKIVENKLKQFYYSRNPEIHSDTNLRKFFFLAYKHNGDINVIISVGPNS
jgi:hypothetical protein